MAKGMEKEENMIKMERLYLKENFLMEKEMEKKKNIILKIKMIIIMI